MLNKNELTSLNGYVDKFIEFKQFFETLENLNQKSSLNTFDEIFKQTKKDMMSFYSRYKDIIYHIDRLSDDDYNLLYSYFLLDNCKNEKRIRKIIGDFQWQKSMKN